MTIPDLGAVALGWVRDLEMYGITAVLSAAELTGEPAVLLRPPRVQPTFDGGADLTWTFLAVAADTETSSAIAELGALLSALSEAMPGAWSLAEPIDVTAAPDLGTLPGYRFTINQRLEGTT